MEFIVMGILFAMLAFVIGLYCFEPYIERAMAKRRVKNRIKKQLQEKVQDTNGIKKRVRKMIPKQTLTPKMFGEWLLRSGKNKMLARKSKILSRAR